MLIVGRVCRHTLLGLKTCFLSQVIIKLDFFKKKLIFCIKTDILLFFLIKYFFCGKEDFWRSLLLEGIHKMSS